MLRREGDETTVQRRAGKPAVDNASLVTVRFIRTDTRGSSSRPGERFSTKRPDTFTQTRCFAQLQTSCSQAADHTLSPPMTLYCRLRRAFLSNRHRFSPVEFHFRSEKNIALRGMRMLASVD